MEPNFEKMALVPQPNDEERFLAVSAEVPLFLTMSMAAASIFSFVMLVGLAIIKHLFRYYLLQKYGNPMQFQYVLGTQCRKVLKNVHICFSFWNG